MHPYARKFGELAASLAFLPVLAALGAAQGSPTQGCIDPPVCGAWEGPYDWGVQTCSGGDSLSHCTPSGCVDAFGMPLEPAWGEIPHAVLVLKDASSSPQEWRVLLVNTASPSDPDAWSG